MEETKKTNQQEQLENQEDQEKALVPLQVSQTEFYGDRIQVILVEREGQRQVHVPIRQLCDYLGLDWSGQRQRMLRDSVLLRNLTHIIVEQSRQRYRTLCLPLEILPGWLFGIAPSRVKPALIPKLQNYREECFRALWRAVQEGHLWQSTE